MNRFSAAQVQERLAAGAVVAAVMADAQSGTQTFSTARPLSRPQERAINKLAGE